MRAPTTARLDQEAREIVIASLMRHEGATGVQSHVLTFEAYLRRRGRPAHFVNPFSSRSPLLPPLFAVRRGLRLVSPSSSVWWYRHWHARFLQRVVGRQLAGDRAAVIYAQCPVSADAALRVRTDQPVVMAAHFNISQADEWAGKGEIREHGRLFREIRAFEDRVLSGLDGIVYVSEFSRGVLQERIPALAHVPGVVVPNPVDILPPAAGPPVADLITVGSLEHRKNHSYLLQVVHEAAVRGHRYTLSVVGDGPQRAALESLSRRLGLQDHVRFYGYQAEVRPLLARHRVYCHTAHMESFGIVLLEAMAEGVPVLAGGVGGIPEVVRPGRDGEFWPLDDPRAAADVLVALMEDPARRAALAKTAREHAAERFAVDLVGERLLDFLTTTDVRS